MRNVKFNVPSRLFFPVVVLLASSSLVHAQLGGTAYRALGQPDLFHSGVNQVLGIELSSPGGVAVDARDGAVHLYISDSRNHRVLAWRDVGSYQVGDPPAVVLGQSSPQNSAPVFPAGLNTPLGLAVDPRSGNLYVADSGNNRVIRFQAPFANPARSEPDAFYGQPDFNTRAPNASGIARNSMNKPRGLAFDAAGNLWVADSGNHRILRFGAALLDSPAPLDADTVIGQPDFNSGGANRGAGVSASGFDTPWGIALDTRGNLFVSDSNNARVLKFPAPFGLGNPDPAATTVFGQTLFTTRAVPAQTSSSSLDGPAGIEVDGAGNLYVAVPNDNRVMIFATASAAPATNVLGQSDFISTQANVNVSPFSSPNTLSSPSDVAVDSSGNVFLADSGNNRVVMLPPGSKSANRVWGQADFSGNAPNQVKPGSLNTPYKIAVDYSDTPFALYVSDTNNHRVLVWKDAARFQTGDRADLVIGQPDFLSAAANIDTRGSLTPSRTSLSSPKGIAVDSGGYLYIADSGNNRILRYPKPVNQSGRITPDIVIGQTGFTTSGAGSNSSSLRSPAGIAIGPDDHLFVSDNGNNRVLEFSSGSGFGSAAVRVYGQPNFLSSSAPSSISAQTLTAPEGLFVDSAYNLYVADAGDNRVLVFTNTQSASVAGAVATFVIGQNRFDTSTASTIRHPMDVGVDSTGGIYVSDAANNRIFTFASLLFLPSAGARPNAVIGQKDTTSNQPNWNSTDGLPTAEGLSAPWAVYLDRQDTLYVGDTGNSRVVHFLKAASIMNAASLQASTPVAPGGVVSLFGTGFGDGADTDPGASWPTSLANLEVVVNDTNTAPLQFVHPRQINLQMPTGTPGGSARVAVRLSDTAELMAGTTVLVTSSAPGLFTTSLDGFAPGPVLNTDGSRNSSSAPAAKGSVISLFGTGQGPVSPPVANGGVAPAAPTANTVAVPTSDIQTCSTRQPSLCVILGNSASAVLGNIQFSGLTPGFVGIWQIDVQIPQTAPSGNAVPVTAVINGAPSNSITVAIK